MRNKLRERLPDADDAMRGIDRKAGVRYPVLVPNERGLERARRTGYQNGCGRPRRRAYERVGVHAARKRRSRTRCPPLWRTSACAVENLS